MEQKRSGFTGKIGFVLSAAGSAVGLGNLWRFPYLAAKYGGGIFLLVYIILSVTFGFSLMIAEIAIGRKTGMSAITAYGKLNKKFSFLGYLSALIPIIILPYYSVIGGWVTKYLFVYSTGGGIAAAKNDFFGNFISDTVSPIFWFAIFIGLTALIVLFGVQKGVEAVSKFMMPVLVVLSIFIAVWVVCMPGTGQGLKYYLLPDFASLTAKNFCMAIIAAMGQLFYSMSLAMGIMITYGSYMKKDVSIESSVHQIEIFDTAIAIIAGLMIVPSVVAFGGGKPTQSGPGLMFETLPKVFDKMPLGEVIGSVFFLLVLLAALTSSISLMETVISIFQDKLKWNRNVSCLVVFAGSVIIGLPSSLGFGIWSNIKPLGKDLLTFFDFVSNSVMMPIAALLTCILVGYVIKPKCIIEEVEESGKFKGKKLFRIVIRYIAPICLALILVFAVLDAFGIVKI